MKKKNSPSDERIETIAGQSDAEWMMDFYVRAMLILMKCKI